MSGAWYEFNAGTLPGSEIIVVGVGFVLGVLALLVMGCIAK